MSGVLIVLKAHCLLSIVNCRFVKLTVIDEQLETHGLL